MKLLNKTGFKRERRPAWGLFFLLSGLLLSVPAWGQLNTNVISSASPNITAPVVGAAPSNTCTGQTGYNCSSVSWSPSNSTFQYNTSYTITATLTANRNYYFANTISVTVNGQAATITNYTYSSVTFTYTFPSTGPAPITSASVSVTAPTGGATPSNACTPGNANYSCASVSWSPSHSPFNYGTQYTATVTLAANNGYTFSGLGSATLNGHAASISNNTGSRVTLAYAFTTAPYSIASVSAEVTEPATGTVPSNACASVSAGFSCGSLSWEPNHSTFQSGTEYTVTVTLNANAGNTFTGLTSASINGETATILSNTGGTLTLEYTFAETERPPELSTTPSLHFEDSSSHPSFNVSSNQDATPLWQVIENGAAPCPPVGDPSYVAGAPMSAGVEFVGSLGSLNPGTHHLFCFYLSNINGESNIWEEAFFTATPVDEDLETTVNTANGGGETLQSRTLSMGGGVGCSTSTGNTSLAGLGLVLSLALLTRLSRRKLT